MLWRVAQILRPQRYAAVARADRLFYWLFGGLGLISYGVYLFHYPIMRLMAAQEGFVSIVSLAIAIIAAIFLAYVGEALAKRPAYGFLRLRYVR
jgi:peptidoglycan/LPS O-acetylase OafA/YrhL